MWYYGERLESKNQQTPAHHVMLKVTYAAVIYLFIYFSHTQQSPWQKSDKGLKISFKDVPRVHVPLVERVNKGHFFCSDFTLGDGSWDFDWFGVAPWWRGSHVKSWH